MQIFMQIVETQMYITERAHPTNKQTCETEEQYEYVDVEVTDSEEEEDSEEEYTEVRARLW